MSYERLAMSEERRAISEERLAKSHSLNHFFRIFAVLFVLDTQTGLTGFDSREVGL
jgi:hypothetical protein